MSEIRTFWQGRTSVGGPRAARFHGDHDPYDLAAIDAVGSPGIRVLDLGCGTCLIANALVQDRGWSVHAVDFIAEFLGGAADDPRLTTEQSDVRTFTRDERFDLILSLGVITYLEDPAERSAMYAHCAGMLHPGAPLFIKAQFGVADDVVVDTYSEDLDARYRAVYPQLDAEVQRLSELFDVTVIDPYPPAFSRWDDTHFHHLVARRKRR
jgi:trans-aconitate methyltransferase